MNKAELTARYYEFTRGLFHSTRRFMVVVGDAAAVMHGVIPETEVLEIEVPVFLYTQYIAHLRESTHAGITTVKPHPDVTVRVGWFTWRRDSYKAMDAVMVSTIPTVLHDKHRVMTHYQTTASDRNRHYRDIKLMLERYNDILVGDDWDVFRHWFDLQTSGDHTDGVVDYAFQEPGSIPVKYLDGWVHHPIHYSTPVTMARTPAASLGPETTAAIDRLMGRVSYHYDRTWEGLCGIIRRDLDVREMSASRENKRRSGGKDFQTRNKQKQACKDRILANFPLKIGTSK